MSSGNKYHRRIGSVDEIGESITVDVYSVLVAFDVTCPGLQQAVKKLLCAGLRGKASREQDLTEAKDALIRAIELHRQRNGYPVTLRPHNATASDGSIGTVV